MVDSQIFQALIFYITGVTLISTSLLCVAFLVSREMISLKMVSGEKSSNENVFLLSNVSLIICMIGWFLYF